VLINRGGLKNVLVTNGFISPEPFKALLPYIDAMNIDLKAFTDDFYRKTGGRLDVIKEIIKLAAKRCHVEVTTLVIPGENDNDVESIAMWLSELSPSIPLHLSRFFPRYKYCDRKPTPKEAVIRLSETAQKYLENVYIGNMH